MASDLNRFSSENLWRISGNAYEKGGKIVFLHKYKNAIVNKSRKDEN